jgi:hypothetical protein
MRVLSGRASCGARAVLRALLGGAFAVLGLIAGGCGSTTFTYGTPVVSFSTTPGPFTAYLVTINSILLTRSDGTTVYPQIIPEVVDFTRFTNLSELFGTPALIEGTYTSATISLDYSTAQIFMSVNGANTQITTIYDGNASAANTAATTVSYVVKFDPNHPLVIKHGVSSPIDFNFDLSASSVLNTSGSTPTLTVRPMITASTQPVYRNTLRSRGLYVTTDTVNSNFTINSRAFFDLNSSPTGAIAIQTDANTTYNINGVTFTGAAGLAAINTLPINTIIEAYGAIGDLNAIKPTFVATQVYAGVAAQNAALYHLTGTVSVRSGDTLTVHGAEVQTALSSLSVTGVEVAFYDTLTVTISDKTTVNVDGQPNITSPNIGLISVGQQIDVEGTPTLDSSGTLTALDATGGLVRLVPTTLWGSVNSAAGTTLATNLLTLGGFPPDTQAYTGTGSATGADADPTNYQVANGSTTDLSTLAPNSLVRGDGMVTAFGGAPPDFTASAITPGSSTDQLLVVDWANGGSTSPFTVASDGITVNMSDANLGTSHVVQTGPPILTSSYTTIDLTNPVINPKIIPDPQITSQFTVGNSSSTGYTVFHSYSGFQTQVSTVMNGTNKFQKLVAVGKWDGANFTAYRIDLIQLP